MSAVLIKTAAYLCTGCGIGDTLDGAQLAKVARREGKMALVREHAFLCSEAGVQQIRDDIANVAVTRTGMSQAGAGSGLSAPAGFGNACSTSTQLTTGTSTANGQVTGMKTDRPAAAKYAA